MTLQQRLDDAHARSADIYRRRTQIEQQRQQVVVAAQQCDIEMTKIDGEIRVLETMIADESQGQSAKPKRQRHLKKVAQIGSVAEHG